MKIEEIKLFKLSLPTREVYKMARGAHESLKSLLVRITTDNGVIGYGEAHQGVAGYSAETVETMHVLISHVYGPRVIGRDPRELEKLHSELTEERIGNPFARSALEMALFDVAAQSREMRVASLLGGPVREGLRLSGSIGIADPESVAQRARALFEAGYQTIKVKVGGENVQKDIDRVRAVREAVGSGAQIRVDANSGYDLPQALAFVRGIGDLGVEHLEQPLPRQDIDGMIRVRQVGAVPIMADEGVISPSDAYRLIANHAVDAIKLKLTKVGGFINARGIIAICESAGIKVIIGQGLCSSVEAAGEAHLACAFKYVDPVGEMVGPAKLIDDIVEEPLNLSKGTLTLPPGKGIGMVPVEAKLALYSGKSFSLRARGSGIDKYAADTERARSIDGGARIGQ